MKSYSYKIALFTGRLGLVGAVTYLVVAILLPLAVMYAFIASVALFFVAIGYFVYRLLRSIVN